MAMRTHNTKDDSRTDPISTASGEQGAPRDACSLIALDI